MPKKNTKKKEPRVYTLSDGQRVTAQQVAAATGIKDKTAYCRLANTDDPVKVFAKKGKTSGIGYIDNSKRDNAEEPEVPLTTQEKYEKRCRETKPFYVDKLYRLMLKII